MFLFGGVFAKQLFSRLDRMNATDDEQWRAIRQHERELGAHEAILKTNQLGQTSD